MRGQRHLRIYRAQIPDARGGGTHESSARRYFCRHCGSALWVWDPTWPELVRPHAGAIDTPLPEPPDHVHCLVGSKATWVEIEGKSGDPRFAHRAIAHSRRVTIAGAHHASPFEQPAAFNRALREHLRAASAAAG